MRRFFLFLSIVGFLFSVSFIQIAEAASFKDLPKTHRAYKEINYLAEKNIVQGNGAGFYRPSHNVTRAEAVAMIGRAIGLDGTQKETSFRDVPQHSFASGYVEEAVKKGIIRGYGEGVFNPGDHVTRGEMALMISRAFDLGETRSTAAAAKILTGMGIAKGKANGDFGLSESIIRADFAVFLARALNEDYRTAPVFTERKVVTVEEPDTLNVRTGPSKEYEIVDELPNGTVVHVAYYKDEWAYMKSGEVEGYVHRHYLDSFRVSTGSGRNPIGNKVIVIDPGHGGHDNGASGFGLREKDVVLDTSLRVKEYIEDSPFTVRLTRDTDRFIELKDRVAFAKQQNADIFASIHVNAFNGSANGTETYYYGIARNANVTESRALAAYIQQRMLTYGKLRDRGTKHGNFHVLRENSMPAVLVELGFIDHRGDNDKLKSPQWRQTAAKAIYLGILDYYYHFENLDIGDLYKKVDASPSKKLH